MAEEAVQSEREKTEETPSPNKKKAKRGITIGIIAAVIVVAGVGFGVWHSQPSFCAAICHTPMDAYLSSYEGTTDKYGVELDKQSSLSVMAHYHSKVGMDCLDCHVPTIQEQITEGINWVSGNYEVEGTNAIGQTVLETRSLSDITANQNVEKSVDYCLTAGCHVDDNAQPIESLADLARTTSDLARNPHSSPHRAYQCNECHSGHAQSVVLCEQCHEDTVVPNNWLSISEAAEIETVQ